MREKACRDASEAGGRAVGVHQAAPSSHHLLRLQRAAGNRATGSAVQRFMTNARATATARGFAERLVTEPHRGVLADYRDLPGGDRDEVAHETLRLLRDNDPGVLAFVRARGGTNALTSAADSEWGRAVLSEMARELRGGVSTAAEGADARALDAAVAEGERRAAARARTDAAAGRRRARVWEHGLPVVPQAGGPAPGAARPAFLTWLASAPVATLAEDTVREVLATAGSLPAWPEFAALPATARQVVLDQVAAAVLRSRELVEEQRRVAAELAWQERHGPRIEAARPSPAEELAALRSLSGPFALVAFYGALLGGHDMATCIRIGQAASVLDALLVPEVAAGMTARMRAPARPSGTPAGPRFAPPTPSALVHGAGEAPIAGRDRPAARPSQPGWARTPAANDTHLHGQHEGPANSQNPPPLADTGTVPRRAAAPGPPLRLVPPAPASPDRPRASTSTQPPPVVSPAQASPAAQADLEAAQGRVADLTRRLATARSSADDDPRRADLEARIAARARAVCVAFRGTAEGRAMVGNPEAAAHQRALINADDEVIELRQRLRELDDVPTALAAELETARLQVARARDALVGSQVLDAVDLSTAQHLSEAERAVLRRLGREDWQALGAAAGPVADVADLAGRANTLKGRIGELLLHRHPQLTSQPGQLPPMVEEARSRAQGLGIDPAEVGVVRLRTRTFSQATGLPTGMGELGDVVIGAEHNGRFRVLTLVEVKAGPSAVSNLWTTPGRLGQLRSDLDRIAGLPLEIRAHREGGAPVVSHRPGVNDEARVRIVVVTTPSERARAEHGVDPEFPNAEFMSLPVDNAGINQLVRRLMRHANPGVPASLIDALLP